MDTGFLERMQDGDFFGTFRLRSGRSGIWFELEKDHSEGVFRSKQELLNEAMLLEWRARFLRQAAERWEQVANCHIETRKDE